MYIPRPEIYGWFLSKIMYPLYYDSLKNKDSLAIYLSLRNMKTSLVNIYLRNSYIWNHIINLLEQNINFEPENDDDIEYIYETENIIDNLKQNIL